MKRNKVVSAPGLRKFVLLEYLSGPPISLDTSQVSPRTKDAFSRPTQEAETIDNTDIIANFVSFLLINFREEKHLRESFQKFHQEQQMRRMPAIIGQDPLLEAGAFFPHASPESLYTLNTVRKFIETHITDFGSEEASPSAMAVFSQYLVHYYSTYPGGKTWRDQPIDVSSVTRDPENRFVCYFADKKGNIYPVYRVKKPIHTSIIQRVVDSAWADLFKIVWGNPSEAYGEVSEILEQRQFVSVALMKYAVHPWYLVLNTYNAPIAFISALPISIGMEGQPEMKAIYVSGAYTIQDAKGLGIGTYLQRMVMHEFSESLGISDRDMFPIIFRTNNYAIVKNLEEIPKRHFEIDLFDGFRQFEKYFRVWLNKFEACSRCDCVGRGKISEESTGDPVSLLEQAQVVIRDPSGKINLNWDFVLDPTFWNQLLKTWASGGSVVTIADLQIEAQEIEPFTTKFKPHVQTYCNEAFRTIWMSAEMITLIQDRLTDLFITFMLSFPRTKESDMKMAKIAEICVPITLQVICDARAEHKEGWPLGRWEKRESELKQAELAKRWNPVVPSLKKLLVKSKNDIRSRKRSMIYNVFDFFRKEGWVSIVLVSYPRWISAAAVEGGFLYRLSTLGNRGIKKENEVRYKRAITKKYDEIEKQIRSLERSCQHAVTSDSSIFPINSEADDLINPSESQFDESESILREADAAPGRAVGGRRRSMSVWAPLTLVLDTDSPEQQIERMRKALRAFRQEGLYDPSDQTTYTSLIRFQESVRDLSRRVLK